jgi:hypothetical protein
MPFKNNIHKFQKPKKAISSKKSKKVVSKDFLKKEKNIYLYLKGQRSMESSSYI